MKNQFSNFLILFLFFSSISILHSQTPKLEVDGFIQTNIGGFIFPDGSVQTTSATNNGGSPDNLGDHTATQNINLNGYFLSGDGGNEGLFVKNDGKIGIGLTTPLRQLHIKGNGEMFALEGNTSSYLSIYPIGYNSGRKAWLGFGTTNTENLTIRNQYVNGQIRFWTGTTTNMTILSNGNVGIGTASPQNILHLKDNGEMLKLESSTHGYIGFYPDELSGGRKAWFGFGSASTNDLNLVNEETNGSLKINVGGAQRMRIISDGKTGIGTSSPTEQLEVAGTIYSNTGGYKFPDGSIQATASLGGNDNLGDHTVTQNIKLGSYYLSGDGGDEGLLVNSNGKVFIESKTGGNLLRLKDDTNIGIGARTWLSFHQADNVRLGYIGADSPSNNYLTILSESGNGLHFKTNGSNTRMTILPDGKIGIGTSSPSEELEVAGTIYSTTGGYKFPDGTIQTTAGSNDNLGNHTATEDIKLEGNWLNNDGGNEGIRILDNGKVGIGIATIPSDFLFAVNGNIIAEELRVELQGDWPDYVFKPNYQLLPLQELESFIKEKGHLPNVPTSEKVEEQKGVDVGSLQRTLLEKVEELTLYIIEIDKENKTLKKRIEELENK